MKTPTVPLLLTLLAALQLTLCAPIAPLALRAPHDRPGGGAPSDESLDGPITVGSGAPRFGKALAGLRPGK